jgi:AcrR family transcriptional regulator
MPRRPAPKRPRWKRRPDARPEEIIEAAIEVFGERGFARTKLDDVARRAGISKGTLYLYFDSKDALFRAMMKQRLEAKIASAEELVGNWTGTSADLLRAYVTMHSATMNHPQNVRIIRLVMSELVNFPELAKWYYQEGIVRMRGVIERILARGVSTGEFRHTAHAAFTARLLQLLCAQTAQFRYYLQPFDPDPISSEAMLAGILDLYLHGIVAAPTHPVAGR